MAESVRRRQTEVALPSYTERDTSIAAPAYTEYLEPQEQEEIYEAAWQPSRSSSSPTTPLMSAQAPTPATPASPPHTLPPFNFSTPTNTSAAARRSSAGVPNTPMSPISLNFGSVPSTPVGATAAPGDESGVFEDDLTVVPPKMIEALGLHDPDQEQDGEQGATARPLYPPVDDDPVVGWNAPPPTNMDAPPPYIPRRMLSVGGEKPLKIDQVDQLKREMTHPGGIKITFRRVDVFRTLACVDCFGSVWIVGWMQKLRPLLSRALHIGDQVISVNGHVVENARMVHKTVKYTPEHEKVVLIVKRLPHAKVYAITRTEQRQDIGVVCKGVTAEILAVEPFGLAAIAGLPTQATSVDGTTACSWWITEVNHRSLNLFYKNNEVQTRLNAVGLDLSFVVQPVDLIAALKKQMKTAYKNYKEFIVQ